MINIVTGSELNYLDGEERVDMCKAIEDMRNDAREKGIEKGIEKGVLATLAGLVKDGILSVADAAKRANMTTSEFESKAGLNSEA